MPKLKLLGWITYNFNIWPRKILSDIILIVYFRFKKGNLCNASIGANYPSDLEKILEHI